MNKAAPQSFHFEYPIRNDPQLTALKEFSGLESNPDQSVIENARSIIGYTHALFSHDGDNTPSSNDPLTILKEAQAGQSFRCVEYSTLAAGLLWANGIQARTIGLKTRDVETRKYGAGHVVIEFWDTNENKWIMSDVQAGIIPLSDTTALSAYELKQSFDKGGQVTYATVANSRFRNGTYGSSPNYRDWIKEYLYFIDTPISLTLGNEDKPKQQIVMLVPDGIQPPKMFQGLFQMNALYTHQPQTFYESPINN